MYIYDFSGDYKLGWNAAPELIAATVIIILIINSSGAYSIPSARNRMFKLTLWFSAVCLIINSASVFAIEYASHIPLWFNIALNTVYFIIYPLMSSLFIIYLMLLMFEDVPEHHKVRLQIGLWFIGISILINIILSITNIWTGVLFSFNEQFEYVRGTLNRWSFYLVIYTIVIGFVLVIIEKRFIDPFLLKIIWWFPFLSVAILLIQQIYRTLMLSGTAMMVAILAVYLNFQNRKITEDVLTKLANRESFTKYLQLAIRRNKNAAVILVSLDDFKMVNDIFGREKGNAFLIECSNMLKDLFPDDQVFRFGGDEFAIIMASDDKHHDSKSIIASIIKTFAHPISVGGVQTRLDASIVCMTIPLDSDVETHPITILDFAMRMAKNKGRSQVIELDASIYTEIRRRNLIMERLKAGMIDSVYHVEFQPIYESEYGSIVMAETLLRMKDPILNDVSPNEFIPLAEELGVISDIGLWVFEQACMVVNKFIANNVPPPILSVNISGSQFFLDTPAERILDVYRRYGIPDGCIKLEITETTFLGSSYPEIFKVMKTLIDEGIHFNLDDFGTGYSNLSSVANLPFEAIKLDRSLIGDVMVNENGRRFIHALITAITLTGAKVIAEGVESMEQVEYLQSLGCTLIQGYVYSQPVDEQEFMRLWINSKHSELPLLDQNPPLL